MLNIIIGVVIATIVLVGGSLGYVYKQGIKISSGVCEGEKLRQELVNKESELDIQKQLTTNTQELVDEVNKQLALQQLQEAKLQEKIDELRKNKVTGSDNYVCVPDGVLDEIRKLRLLRRPL